MLELNLTVKHLHAFLLFNNVALEYW